MSKKDWETNGYRNGDPIYCPVNAYGECPYCDQCNMCHVADPIEDCDDFACFFESWDDWVKANDVDPDALESFAEDEIHWAMYTAMKIRWRIMKNESTRQKRKSISP